VKIIHQSKITGGNRDGNEFRGFSHQGGAARGGLAPPVCEEHTDSFSYPFSSHDFSYLVKTAKIIKEEFFVKLFGLELLPIRKRTLQVSTNCIG
jgi:hypothetical protein